MLVDPVYDKEAIKCTTCTKKGSFREEAGVHRITLKVTDLTPEWRSSVSTRLLIPDFIPIQKEGLHAN